MFAFRTFCCAFWGGGAKRVCFLGTFFVLRNDEQKKMSRANPRKPRNASERPNKIGSFKLAERILKSRCWLFHSSYRCCLRFGQCWSTFKQIQCPKRVTVQVRAGFQEATQAQKANGYTCILPKHRCVYFLDWLYVLLYSIFSCLKLLVWCASLLAPV